MALLATPLFLLQGVIVADKNRNLPTSLADVHRALAIETSAAIHDRITLRDAVCAYLSAERAKGTPVHHITQTLRAVLGKSDEVDGGPDDLAHHLVDWCMKLRASPGF